MRDEHRRSFPECHYHTLTLQKRIEALEVEEVVPYEALSELIGENVRAVIHLLFSARRRARMAAGIVTAAIPSIGIQRLSDPGILGLASSRSRHIGRTARQAIRELGHVEFGTLTDEDKRRHNVYASHMGIVAHLSRPGTQRKLAGVVATERKMLPLGEYFAAIRGHV